MGGLVEHPDRYDVMRRAVSTIIGAELIDDERRGQFAHMAHIQHLERGDTLVHQGDRPTTVDFLLRGGVLRCFRLSTGGSDLTDCFIMWPGEPAVAAPEFDIPAPASIEALSAADILSFDAHELYDLVMGDLALSRWYIALLQQAWHRHWDAKCALQQLDMLGRYEWFLEAYPGLIDLVSHRFVASFLGMTQVTLSRVRARHRAS